MTKITEDFVSFHIKEYLIHKKNFEIILYDPPGGGRSFSVPLSNGEIIYPDIIGLRNETIIIVENKKSYCNDDVDKLNILRKDKKANKYLHEKIKQHLDQKITSPNFLYFHGFHFNKKAFLHNNLNIGLIVVDAFGSVSGDLENV